MKPTIIGSNPGRSSVELQQSAASPIPLEMRAAVQKSATVAAA